ncbi:hypothetical protein [Kocuria rhizophila]|uniref:hypothetical protein n=1 Tax=Kocuria rhizophila TaxID=72000 RepID=UPI0016425CF5|nr:hypothetical protein [Kocuria rhizophila]
MQNIHDDSFVLANLAGLDPPSVETRHNRGRAQTLVIQSPRQRSLAARMCSLGDRLLR